MNESSDRLSDVNGLNVLNLSYGPKSLKPSAI
jgi:hypothetical protein